MSRASVLFALTLVGLPLACKSEKPKATTVASATANPYAIEDDDVPVSVDFEEESLKAITPANVEEEVAKMEKELE